jgi:hypothetical protein
VLTISGSEYRDSSYKRALQINSDVSTSAFVSQLFNLYLFDWMHGTIRQSLRSKRNLALNETSARHWDQVIEILCQVDADILSEAWLSSYEVATSWFDVWKVSSQFFNLNYPSDIYFLDTSRRPLGRGNCL